MYKCNDCGATFEEPQEEFEYHSEVDTMCYERSEVCPACGSYDYEEERNE